MNDDDILNFQRFNQSSVDVEGYESLDDDIRTLTNKKVALSKANTRQFIAKAMLGVLAVIVGTGLVAAFFPDQKEFTNVMELLKIIVPIVTFVWGYYFGAAKET